ncbi:MAG TPA: zf-HC2 domain-containing protein [Thermoanaerobaculia bacterium]|nr:zf-HC2 domain-containing protein [Thermoanaerobaculia bacterium]
MSDPAAQIKAVVAGLVEARGAAPHLTEDEIAAYHAGTLPPDQETRVQDHLLACPACTDLLLGLEELAGEGEPVPPGEVAAAWQQMRALLPLPAKEPAPALPAPLPFPAARRTAVPRWFGALAASLLLAVVGLTVNNVSLRQTVRELSSPQTDAPVVDLFPGPLRGGRDKVETLTLAPDVRVFLLVINPTDSRPFPRYEMEIARAGGAAVWRGKVTRNDLGSFSLVLPRALVGEGEYQLHLWGDTGRGREALGEYGLRIVAR